MNTATGEKYMDLDDAFLLWLEDHSTGELLSDMALNADRAAANINTGNLHWVGPDVIAAGAGLTSGRDPSGHVQMYAPNPLPAYSEVMLAGLLVAGYDPWALWCWATAGNTLGACLNWVL